MTPTLPLAPSATCFLLKARHAVLPAWTVSRLAMATAGEDGANVLIGDVNVTNATEAAAG
jgi:hypothetical protein